jgi:hypothetical protein
MMRSQMAGRIPHLSDTVRTFFLELRTCMISSGVGVPSTLSIPGHKEGEIHTLEDSIKMRCWKLSKIYRVTAIRGVDVSENS